MAFLNETYDVSTLPKGSNNFEPLPAGWYAASITKAEVCATKDGRGQYIKIRYDITGPTHQGRVMFGNLNIRNASAQAEEIGRQQLGELMRAIGLDRVNDTDQLIGGHLQIKLSVKPADEKYEAGNEVKGFRAIAGAPAPTAMSQSAQHSPAQSASAKAAPPWMKK